MNFDLLSNIGETGVLDIIKVDVLGALAVVAPIAIAILGIFLVWRYAIRFFKGLSK